MGKFSAAKIFDALDQKLQKAVNYLIDLLETGYSVELMLNGVKIKIVVDPKVGLAFYQNGVYRGGMQIIDGELSLATDILKDPDSEYAHARFFQTLIGSLQSFVLRFYSPNDTTTPTGSQKVGLLYGYFTPDDGLTGFDHSLMEYSSIAKTTSDLATIIVAARAAENQTDNTAKLQMSSGNINHPVAFISAKKASYADAMVDVDAGSGTRLYYKDNVAVVTRTLGVDAVGHYANSLPVFANNAAALAGGLDVGYLYRTGGDPDVVCVVH